MTDRTNYSVRVGDDDENDAYYSTSDDGKTTIRIYYRISRIPSRKEFVVRPLGGATTAEREDLQASLAEIPHLFAYWESRGFVRKTKAVGGYWFWYVYCGRTLDDPLLQLELEAMIDETLSSTVL